MAGLVLSRHGTWDEPPGGVTMRSIMSMGASFVKFCADIELGVGKLNVNSATGGLKLMIAGSALRSSVMIAASSLGLLRSFRTSAKNSATGQDKCIFSTHRTDNIVWK